MAKRSFNRAGEDIGNILCMEHINVTVPDQALATLFYVNGLGMTRDPYIDWGTYNVWVNAGRQQFHLPTAAPQVLRGRIGVVVPDLATLAERLKRLKNRLSGTRFDFDVKSKWVDVVCPWGNRIRCHKPGNWGPMQLGIPYIDFEVSRGASIGIARFYDQVMGCPVSVFSKYCEVHIGQSQKLRFREVRQPHPDYDGHHIAVYVANFSGPHGFLNDQELITEESDEHQYRFQTIVDPETGEALFELEHEVRSLHHPMYERRLINRNAEQSFFTYQKDRDAFTPA